MVEGPYGGFDHLIGGPCQVWIAGGIGITPILSWVNALHKERAPDVDLFYAVASEDQALYVDELAEASAREPGLRLHLSVDKRDGFLTVEKIVATISHDLATCDVSQPPKPPRYFGAGH